LKEGEVLGKLDDFDLDTETWALSELLLEGDRILPIDPTEIVIGRDQILVPQAYAARVVEPSNGGGGRGFFKRVRDWSRSQPGQ